MKVYCQWVLRLLSQVSRHENDWTLVSWKYKLFLSDITWRQRQEILLQVAVFLPVEHSFGQSSDDDDEHDDDADCDCGGVVQVMMMMMMMPAEHSCTQSWDRNIALIRKITSAPSPGIPIPQRGQYNALIFGDKIFADFSVIYKSWWWTLNLPIWASVVSCIFGRPQNTT